MGMHELPHHASPRFQIVLLDTFNPLHAPTQTRLALQVQSHQALSMAALKSGSRIMENATQNTVYKLVIYVGPRAGRNHTVGTLVKLQELEQTLRKLHLGEGKQGPAFSLTSNNTLLGTAGFDAFMFIPFHRWGSRRPPRDDNSAPSKNVIAESFKEVLDAGLPSEGRLSVIIIQTPVTFDAEFFRLGSVFTQNSFI
ncbi:hypothetical protein B0T18DRAFT_390378 [Schizothecium vesticola]|uniref:Uncharacterized protein n=1 Tax=Schizothecium vesticola TaxID=314040 RepID=A0AA40EUV6_9PEZI|nr:hypothetical protein B0T18DRAFT_390378 [Schizothecium vesticola]